MAGSMLDSMKRLSRSRRDNVAMLVMLGGVVSALFLGNLLLPIPVLAGQASSGELFFYPCTQCHPLSPSGEPVAPLPIDFEGHAITLEGHDKLAPGNAACLVCHDDPAKDPGMLKLADGTLLDITTDVPRLCYQCHSAKYKEWVAGTHGRNLPSCSAAGCHDPHTPMYIYAEPLLPFVGAGFQFRVLADREPFTPLAPPAPAPATETPVWYAALVVVGLAAAGGQLIRLLRGRLKR